MAGPTLRDLTATRRHLTTISEATWLELRGRIPTSGKWIAAGGDKLGARNGADAVAEATKLRLLEF